MSVKKEKQQYKTKSGVITGFLKGSKRWFAGGLISLAAVSLLDMLNPKIICVTVDSVIGDKQPDLNGVMLDLYNNMGGREYFRSHIALIAIAIGVIALCTVVCRYIYRVFNAKGAETFVEKIRNTLYGHIESLPYSALNESMTGDLIQRCTSDVNTVKRFVSDQLVSVFRIGILLVLSVVFMARMNIALTLIAAAFIPIIVAYSVIFRGKIEKNFEICDKQEGFLSTIVQENLTGVRVVRAFGREKYEADRFRTQNDIYRNKWISLANLMSCFWNIGDLISALQIMFVVVFGTVFCVKGSLTAGELIAFISYNSMLIWPVRQLGRTITEMSKAGVSIERIRDILIMEPEDTPEKPEYPDMRADIEFRNVGFSYIDGTKTLDAVSFRVPAGKTVGILGGTGSGKSTLMYLLARLYDVTEGEITVGGVPLTNIPRQYVRRNVGIVLQEPFLFSRTLGENISIAIDTKECGDGAETSDRASEAHRELIDESIKIACLDETIEKLTNGLETVVGERGVTLSGGQKQRTAIARMMTSKPPVMIFDDSLSAVDTETDTKIRDALHEKCKGSTVILISHRITTLMDADEIIVLDKGKVVETGTHSELLKNNNGIYRKIYDIQNQNAEEVS